MMAEKEDAANARVGPYALVLAEVCAREKVESYEVTANTAAGKRYTVKVELVEEGDQTDE